MLIFFSNGTSAFAMGNFEIWTASNRNKGYQDNLRIF